MAQHAAASFGQTEVHPEFGHQGVFMHSVGGPHFVDGLAVVEHVGDHAGHRSFWKHRRHLVSHVSRVVQVIGPRDHFSVKGMPPLRPRGVILPMTALCHWRWRGEGRRRSAVLGLGQMLSQQVHSFMGGFHKLAWSECGFQGVRDRGQRRHAPKVARRMHRWDTCGASWAIKSTTSVGQDHQFAGRLNRVPQTPLFRVAGFDVQVPHDLA